MRQLVEDRLPYFTEDESKDLKGSVDFIGLNYYTANYAQNAEAVSDPDLRWYATDQQSNLVGRHSLDHMLIKFFVEWQEMFHSLMYMSCFGLLNACIQFEDRMGS